MAKQDRISTNTSETGSVSIEVDEFGEIVERPTSSTQNLPNLDGFSSLYTPDSPNAVVSIAGRHGLAEADDEAEIQPASRMQVVIFWLAVFIGLVMLGVGGYLWGVGIEAEARQPNMLAINRVTTTQEASEESKLTAEQEATFGQNYTAAVNAFNNGQIEKAVGLFKPIVEAAPNYRQEAAASLFVAYRALALDQIKRKEDMPKALGNFDEALLMLNKYAKELRTQFKSRPQLLPSGYKDFDYMVAAMRDEKIKAENYLKADAIDVSQPRWFDDAIALWGDVYKLDKNYLKDNPDRWVVNRLIAAYNARGTYACNNDKAVEPAATALKEALKLANDNNLTTLSQSISELLEQFTSSGCK